MTDNAKIEAAGKETQQYLLRAMARNYAGGHCWDHLDGEACEKAATEIASLRETLDRVTRVDNSLAAQLRKSIENNATVTTEAASLRERVKEYQRDAEAFHRHEQTLRDNSIGSHSEAVVIVTELRRKLDAAREALKLAADTLRVFIAPDMTISTTNAYLMAVAAESRARAITGEK